VAGFLSDRLGRRWPVVAASLLLGGVGIGLMSVKLAALALSGAFLVQVIGGGIESLVPAIAGDRIGRARHGRALGVIYTVGDLGSTLGPPIALGLLNAEWLSLGEIYRGCAVLLAVVALFGLAQVSGERPITVGAEIDRTPAPAK
jgi:MFS family permease